MARELSSGEGTNFYVNGTSITRGTLVVDTFPDIESIRFRRPGEREYKINISKYNDFINGDTKQPFASYADLLDWLNDNVYEVKATDSGGSGDLPSKITTQAETVKGNIVNMRTTGIAFFSQDLLKSGEECSSDWIDLSYFDAFSFFFNSDKDGRYSIEYSNDMITLVSPVIENEFIAARGRRKGALDPDATYTRLTFINTSESDQTMFTMSVWAKVGLTQASLETLAAKGASTRFAQWVKSVIQLPDVDGSYDDIHRYGNAILAYINNDEETPIPVKIIGGMDTSGLSKDETSQAILQALSSLSMEGTLQEVLSKLIANPSTQSDQEASNALLQLISDKIAGPLSVTLKDQSITVSNVIHAIVDNFPSLFHVVVDNPTPAAPNAVAVNNLPDNQKVTLTNTQAIPVSLSAAIHAIIDSLPSVTLAANQSISIANVIHAIIDALPDVNIKNFPTGFNINNIPHVIVDNPTSVTPTDVTALAKDTTAQAILTALAPLSTDATLKAILAKLISAPSTEAKQDAANQLLTALSGKDFATQTTLLAVLTILGSGAQKTQVTNTDYAKETGGNLAAILAKITSDPSTATLQNAILAKLGATLMVASVPTSTGGYPNKDKYLPSGTGGSFTSIVSGVRKLGLLVISNTSNGVISLLVYDKATAPVSSDTPVHSYPIPAGACVAIPMGDGEHFANGIGFGTMAGSNLLSLVTSLLTAVTAGTFTVNYSYI